MQTSDCLRQRNESKQPRAGESVTGDRSNAVAKRDCGKRATPRECIAIHRGHLAGNENFNQAPTIVEHTTAYKCQPISDRDRCQLVVVRKRPRTRASQRVGKRETSEPAFGERVACESL